jgi:ribose 5-phosphate isomerase A
MHLTEVELEKRAAAEAAAALVEDGSTLGLGSGSTAGHLLPALAARKLDLRCVATSPATEEQARRLGFQMEPFDRLDRLDLAIDGADQIDRSGWLVKGGGGAHTREKVVAAAAARFVVIVSSDKLVEALSPPVPLELLPYGHHATLRRLAPVTLRDAPPSPDGGVIADHLGPIADPAELAARLAAVPGVVEHGLFPPELVTEVLVGRGAEVHHFVPGSGSRS